MKRLVLAIALVACGSKEPTSTPKPPPDHELHRTDSPGRVQIVGGAVPLATLPTMDWVGLPMSGEVDVAIDLQKLDDPAKAYGSIRISCPSGCRLGDDKTTLKPRTMRGSAFANELHFGHLDFDRATIAIDFKDGKGTVSTFDVVSKDIAIKLAGSIQLAKTWADARVDLCLRFEGTPGLRERDPKLHDLLLLTGAPRASDGMFNIRLVDSLSTMKRLGVVCDGTAPPPVDDTASGSGAPSMVPSTNNDVDPDVAKQIAAAITRKSDTAYDVDRAKWEALLADPTAMSKGARVVPSVKDGKPRGFKLYAIRPDSIYAKLGLQNGDALLTIGGQALDSAETSLEVYTKIRAMKTGDSVVVEVERNGAPVKLRYTLR